MPTTTTRKPAEVPFERIERTFQLASYNFGSYKPAVFKNSRGTGYGIRVLAKQTSSLRSTTTSYDYFEINADGIITASPRGWASMFNRKRVIGLPEAIVKYAEPDGGETR